MCRYGAEGASAETTAMDVDREFYHVVGRYPFPFVFGVRHACVWQVEAPVEFFLRHGRIWRIDHYYVAVCALQYARGVHLVGFFFYMSEVYGLFFLVFQAFFMAEQHDVAFFLPVETLLGYYIGCLRYVGDVAELFARFQSSAQLCYGLFSHSVYEQVGMAVAQDAFFQSVLPVVVVCEPSHGGFYAAYCHRYVGIQFFQYG